MKILFVLFSLVVLLLASACCKEGPKGDAAIQGTVKHHDALIPGAEVYINYGATEFPGTDLAAYDDKATTDADAFYKFENLCKGSYYLYSVGYDSAGPYPVYGGIPVQIEKKGEVKTSNVPVVE